MTGPGIRQRLAVAALAYAVALALGCGPQPLTPEAKRLLEAGIEAYDRHDDEAAVAQLDTFLRDHSRMQRADEAHYYRGLAHRNLGDGLAAREDLRRAMSRTKEDRMRGKALIALGDLSYDEGDMGEAERMFMRSLDHLQRGQSPRDRALYRLGQALQRQSRWPQANRYFNQLIGDFEGGPLAAEAALRVNAQRWTVQAGQFHNTIDAKELATTLDQALLPAALWRRMIDDELIVYVQVGLYSTYEQAQQALPQVRNICPDAHVAVTR